MINPKEISPGIIVGVGKDFKKVSGYQRGREISAVYFSDGTHVGSHMCSPIPLTPEILENCGFKRWKDDTFEKELGISHAMLRVTPDFGPVFIDFTGDPRCLTRLYHVHQLQNLYFALTGEELEVKL